MLPKKRRISRKEFPDIISKGKRYNSAHLLLHVIQLNSNGANLPSKFSFSISKKVSKKAVQRNKNRRRGYSIVGNAIEKIKPGFLFFFTFKKGSGLVSFNVLEKEITELLSSSLVLI